MNTNDVAEPRIGSKADPKVKSYLDKAHKSRLRDSAVSMWHINLYTDSNGLVELPYRHNETWANVTISDEVKNEETGEYTWPVNEAKTKAVLSAIAKFASKQKGVTVKKNYSGQDFELRIEIPISGSDEDTVSLNYYASREVVCTKRVVGTKVVPARITEEKIEEVVEWDCKPVSLLGFDATVTDDEED